jgi:hypothetical protein
MDWFPSLGTTSFDPCSGFCALRAKVICDGSA